MRWAEQAAGHILELLRPRPLQRYELLARRITWRVDGSVARAAPAMKVVPIGPPGTGLVLNAGGAVLAPKPPLGVVTGGCSEPSVNPARCSSGRENEDSDEQLAPWRDDRGTVGDAVVNAVDVVKEKADKVQNMGVDEFWAVARSVRLRLPHIRPVVLPLAVMDRATDDAGRAASKVDQGSGKMKLNVLEVKSLAAEIELRMKGEAASVQQISLWTGIREGPLRRFLHKMAQLRIFALGDDDIVTCETPVTT